MTSSRPDTKACPDVALIPDFEALEAFLVQHPPFDALHPGELSVVAHAMDRKRFATGDSVLVEDGARSAGMWVVLAGSMELLHEGEVIQALGPGECFGHPSLLSGMAPAFTVRTREPATCGLLGSADARRLLGTEAGAAYVARTTRVRLTRTGHTVHGLLDVGTTPVSAIMRPAAFCAADLPAREAARRLDDEDTSALLVRLADGELGIVTDAEVRAAVAAGGGTLDAPVGVIARAPAPTVPVGQLAIEATVDMLAAGVEHLVVLDGTRPCGVLGAADLLGLDARSPIALRHRSSAPPMRKCSRARPPTSPGSSSCSSGPGCPRAISAAC